MFSLREVAPSEIQIMGKRAPLESHNVPNQVSTNLEKSGNFDFLEKSGNLGKNAKSQGNFRESNIF